MTSNHHFVVLSYPAQGHLNPNLQFSKRLLRIGLRVTFMTSAYARLSTHSDAELPKGLTVVEYFDGYDRTHKDDDEAKRAMERMKNSSSEALRKVVSTAADEGCPVTCVVYSLLLPWVAAVARELHVASALIWIQPATVFDLYYYYFHGFDDVMHELTTDQESDQHGAVELPGLPLKFTSRDLPSFMIPKNPYPAVIELFREHMSELDAEPVARVLVNTFDALESEALTCINKPKLTAVGPLIPSAFLDRDDPTDTGFGGDLFSNTSNNSYVSWLDSKPDSSVIYVSFGTMSVLSSQQMEEVGRGLLDLGKPFLWVIRDNKTDENTMSCIAELEQLGLIVPWCSQLQVLSHPAICCFFTHCGWNSTMEGLISGVPMVGFPQWSDQTTNGKLVEDYWKTGVRVSQKLDGLLERGEIKRCLEVVTGDVEMRRNAMKWKKLAVESVKEGGSSDKNLRDFVDQVANVGDKDDCLDSIENVSEVTSSCVVCELSG